MAVFLNKQYLVNGFNTLFPNIQVEIHDTIDSTNTRSSALLAQNNVPNLVVSGQQTAGYGRLGRQYYSPKNSGIYITMGFNISRNFDKILLYTTHSSVALLQTMKNYVSEDLAVKWVNDIYVGKRKVSGILTQAQQKSDKSLDVTIGIGINFFEPEDGYPDDIIHKADALFQRNDTEAPNVNDFILTLYNQLQHWLQIDNPKICAQALNIYRDKQLLMGKQIAFGQKDNPETGAVIGIDDQYGLMVKTSHHEIKTLNYGEVNILSW